MYMGCWMFRVLHFTSVFFFSKDCALQLSQTKDVNPHLILKWFANDLMNDNFNLTESTELPSQVSSNIRGLWIHLKISSDISQKLKKMLENGFLSRYADVIQHLGPTFIILRHYIHDCKLTWESTMLSIYHWFLMST